MHANTNANARGQILILFAVGLVVLIGFAALAIDGGMILSDRRTDQNATDAAALAGAGAAAQYMQSPTIGGDKQVFDKDFSCGNNTVIHAVAAAYGPAVARAAANGFAILSNPPSGSPNGAWVTCNATKRRIEVKVVVTKAIQTSFAHLFTNGDVVNTVTASAEADPMTTLAQGNAIASLSPNCHKPNSTEAQSDGGLWFLGGGSANIIVKNGGIFSNSCLNSNGSNDVSTQGSPQPPITYVTTLDLGGNAGVFSPYPTQDQPISIRTIPTPNCGGVKSVNFKNGYKGAGKTLTIYPGTYNQAGGLANNHNAAIEGGGTNTTLIMNPGLYCLNGDFDIGSGSTVQVTGYPLTGEHDGVTIYMKSPGIEFDSSGGPTVELQSCTQKNKLGNICDSGAMAGLLLYAIPVSPVNTGLINMGGNPTSVYEGSVYAPTSWIDMGGSPKTGSTDTSGNIVFNTEIIGYVITMHGNVSININYNSTILYHNPTSVSALR